MSHVYASASSLDNSETSRQGHTVNLTPEAIAAIEAHHQPGNGTRIIPADQPGEQTTVIPRRASYTTPKPRPMTLADVERELAKASATDPATFLDVVATHGYPTYQLPPIDESDGAS